MPVALKVLRNEHEHTTECATQRNQTIEREKFRRIQLLRHAYYILKWKLFDRH